MVFEMKDKHKTEKELAQRVIKNLTEMGFEIYQEVEDHGKRCDIVAVNGKIQWAIECKLTFSMGVMEQAYNWLSQNRAHYISVATPSLGMSWLQERMCRDYGIGVLGVKYDEVREIQKPRFNRRAFGFKLFDEQKTFCEAGSNQGGHWTQFKWTIRNLESMVKKNPGIHFDELIKAIDHHYSSFYSAKACLRSYIEKNIIKNVECRVVGRKLCVFPKEVCSEVTKTSNELTY